MDTNVNKEVRSQQQHEIISGPSRDKLFDALKYAYDKDAKFRIEFGFRSPAPHSVPTITRLTSIEHEDGSGCSFNLEGYCTLNGVSRRFHAYYNTRRRGGYLVAEH